MRENLSDPQTSKSLIRSDSVPGRRSEWWVVLILTVWLGFIFGTSCTVIRPQEFFALVQYFVLVDESSMHRFRLFWGVSWFTIVKGWHFTEFAILFLLCTRMLNWWR